MAFGRGAVAGAARFEVGEDCLVDGGTEEAGSAGVHGGGRAGDAGEQHRPSVSSAEVISSSTDDQGHRPGAVVGDLGIEGERPLLDSQAVRGGGGGDDGMTALVDPVVHQRLHRLTRDRLERGPQVGVSVFAYEWVSR